MPSPQSSKQPQGSFNFTRNFITGLLLLVASLYAPMSGAREEKQSENAEVSILFEDAKQREAYLMEAGRMAFNDDPRIEVDGILRFSKYPFVEVVNLLSARWLGEIASYLRGGKELDINPLTADISEAAKIRAEGNVAQAIITVIKGFKNKGVIGHFVNSTNQIGNQLMEQMGGLPAEKVTYIQGMLSALLALAKDSPNTRLGALNLPDLNASRLYNVQPAVEMPAKEHAARVAEHLSKKVVGQEEIVERLKQLELNGYLYRGKAPRTEHLMIMNAPNNGLNYIIREYVNAIHGGAPDAHEKHMESIQEITDSQELAKVMGQYSGIISSQTQPKLIKFLVEHSGGRYKIEPNPAQNGAQMVVANEDWRPGDVWKNTFAPREGVLVIRNEDMWAQAAKDEFFPQALSGKWRIEAPNGGLTEITVNVRVIITSASGSNLVIPRDKKTGLRLGREDSEAELLERWEKVKDSTELLNREIQSNTSPNKGMNDRTAKGIAPSTLNMITNKVLAKPATSAEIRKIIELALNNYNSDTLAYTGKGGFMMEWGPEFVDYLLRFEYRIEDGVSKIESRITEFVKNPINQLIAEGKIEESSSMQILKLSIQEQPDRTAKLLVEVEGKGQPIEAPLTATERVKERQPISDAKLAEYMSIPARMQEKVVGIDHLLSSIRDTVVAMADGNSAVSPYKPESATKPAGVIGAFGMTSTGKTQTPKALAHALYGDETRLLNLPFGTVEHPSQVDQLIFAEDSPFVEAYEKHGGKMIVILDELTNARNPAVFYKLYDLFREKAAGGFADNKVRPMSNIIFVVTGNATKEVYDVIPNDIPLEQQMLAAEEIYKSLMRNPDRIRTILERYLPAPLIARMGMDRIFIFPPFNYKALRELTHMKLREAIKDLSVGEGKRVWKIHYGSKEDYLKLVEYVESEGFEFKDQGASIDAMVKKLIDVKLRKVLYDSTVPSGTNVSFRLAGFEERAREDGDGKEGFAKFEVRVQGTGEILSFEVPMKRRPPVLKENPDLRLSVAAHEIGHLLTNKILFGTKSRMTRVSIIPGVTESGIVFEGIQVSEGVEKFEWSRENIIREMTVLMAGKVAQAAVTKDGAHDAGKGNDIERATDIARKSILRFGNSETWGVESYPRDLTINQIISTLSESRRRQLESEVQAMLVEAETRARILIENNPEVFLAGTLKLAELGDMREQQIEEFFEQYKDKINMDTRLRMTQMVKFASHDIFKKSEAWLRTTFRFYKSSDQDSFYRSDLPRPAKIADIAQFAKDRKAELVAQVPMPKNLPFLDLTSGQVAKSETAYPVGDVLDGQAAARNLRCRGVFN